MTNKIRNFVDTCTKDRQLYDEQQCGIGTSYFQVLSDEEANLVDDAIRIYKLPLQIADNKNKFIDLETSQQYDMEEGLATIYEAILADDGELLNEYMPEQNQMLLYELLIWS